NADRHLNACALRWRPFYTPGDFTVTKKRKNNGIWNVKVQGAAQPGCPLCLWEYKSCRESEGMIKYR
ncbi:hypothetical protein, partial [uncultured Flavonifractor sp.]|uniref:hypothetical protein n=1 Tax=uncultured Flavonifractor sp. TaxID=1193534 RepID=UPI0026121348